MYQIEGHEALMGIQVSSYPHMKPEDQSRLHRKLQRASTPQTENEKPMSMKDLARYLSGR